MTEASAPPRDRARTGVILIHGWACRGDFWREQTEALLGVPVFSLDLPGHGVASRLAGERPTMARLAEEIVALADRHQLDRIALLGHSMGGAVAIEAALRLGPRCKLILGADTFTEAMFYAPRPTDEIAQRRHGFERDFAGAMRGMVGAITAPGADPALVAWIGDAMAQSDETAVLDTLEELLAWDIHPRLAALAVPVETINSAWLAERNELLSLDGVTIHAIDGVGHFPMLENPVRFNAMAREILGRHLGRRLC